MKFDFTLIVVSVLVIIAIYLLYKNYKERSIQHFRGNYRIRTAPKLPLISKSCAYTIIPATTRGGNYYFNGYFYYFYNTSDVPSIFFANVDGYGGLLVKDEFKYSPITISWPATNYQAPHAGPVDTFQIGCGNWECNISNQTFAARCNGDESQCQFGPSPNNPVISYSAVESPTIWPRYYDSNIPPGSKRKKTHIGNSDATLLTLTFVGQYNPN